MNKKDIPLKLVKDLKTINDSIKEETNKVDYIFIHSETITNLIVHDSDENSTFTFELGNSYISSIGESYFKVTYSPTNAISNTKKSHELKKDQVISHFKSWRLLIEEYNSTPLLEEDRIISAYEEEFYSDFEILEDGSENDPFDLEKQILFDDYLKTIETKLIEYNSSDQSFTLIIEEVQELRKSLTNETKKNSIRKLSKILAKIRKLGLEVLKEVWDQTKKEIAKRIVSGGIDMTS
ncbi:MAG: hypothetical protein A3D31_15220 [Candidatus Fluviicola riflensis]|nr:MAG: hypothetical protein CHH17_00155 [Candidatus Fluviicola riflensis]OGS78312.1 MAG: hypothetical protein A3D31_15220 [Candidatus Fluviicola riflensis]OGS85378.1 MAG: hypothetical protein A2724_12155 [Fluviicola sp. RIFCSPHIGHO2_01_FULL_43_53]OGS87420.1 MAG: hypothetical protein A3E30_08575 [Fluviicola sp. RIFCSPHIGHO2_12_FULL_43_24]